MKRIIQSLLDTDLYKISMCQAVFYKFPWANARFEFINRGKHKFTKEFLLLFKEQLTYMSELQLSPDQLLWLKDKTKLGRFLTPNYLDFLFGHRFDPSEVTATLENDGDLKISIEGPWYRTILWEVPLMAVICELYYILYHNGEAVVSRTDILDQTNISKIKGIEDIGLRYSEFATRRRFSYEVQRRFYDQAHKSDMCVGTSNVHLAYLYDTKAIGTTAHEWYQAHAAKYGYRMANEMAMKNWVDVYDGDLGIVLPDTFTTDVFLDSFTTKYAKLFDGGRQDSGPEDVWADKWISHYKKLGIDPMSKTAVFSNGINSLERVQFIKDITDGQINGSAGIGTWFSNDCYDIAGNSIPSMNIVIKMMGFQPKGYEKWIPTIKISDEPGKASGNEEEIITAKRVLEIKQ